MWQFQESSFFLVLAGDGTGKAQKAGSAAGASYTNPAFHGDEAGAAAARPASLSRAEQGRDHLSSGIYGFGASKCVQSTSQKK